MISPPRAVSLVCTGLAILFDIPIEYIPIEYSSSLESPGKKYPNYWSSCKKHLLNVELLKRLREFDKENITLKTLQKL